MGRKKKKQLKPWCWYPFNGAYFITAAGFGTLFKAIKHASCHFVCQ